MVNTLHNMENHIHTSFRDSAKSGSQKKWHAPIASISQGNGAGPQIWVAVSTLLLELMVKDGFFATVVSKMSLIAWNLVGFAFVDDTDLCVTHSDSTSEAVANHIQDSICNWEGLLKATDGALVPNKCFWYFISFQFWNGSLSYQPTSQTPSKLSVHDNKGQLLTIPWLECSEAWQTLGVWIAPDGNVHVELQHLILIAKAWNVRMAKARLSQYDVTFSLWHVIFWKLMYPLLTTTFSPAQCNQIMAPILAWGLPTAGFVWTFPCTLVHSPLMYGGADIPNLHTKLTIARILQVLSIPYCSGTMAFLIQACSEVMRLEAGIAGELLSIPLLFQPLIAPSWLKHICKCSRSAIFA